MKARWFQFSMRALMLMILVASLVLGMVEYWRHPHLERDIKARIRQDFSSDKYREVENILLTLQSPSNFPRIHRCILHVADGDLDRLSRMVKLAETDYRDAILWAEYGGPEQIREYDFGRTFSKARMRPREQ